jgi:pectate lyase
MFMKRVVSVFACTCIAAFSQVGAQVSFQNVSGSLESAYAEWASDGSDSYNVYYSGAGSKDVKVDAPLIRKYGSKVRVDVVGLKAGDYTFKVVSVKGGKEGASATSEAVSVKAHDRSGFAFSDGHIPGAYNADGSLKKDAVVLYVSESTKNSVKLDVVTSSKGAVTECAGLQNILTALKKGYETRPLAIRLMGNVTDPQETDHGDIVIDMGKKEGLAVTLEGIGNDATANGWGIRIKNAQDVEVRNIGIMNVDSDEGDNISLQQDNKYIWVHNCDFFYGHAGSDKDQVKGDGALDCKKSTYITFSYNHFWDNGKSNLLGLSESTTDGLYITYHHNWYDHSDSRHPRVRYYSAHVYNNYYDGNAKYGASSTLGSSVFMEANYFRNCKYPMMTSMQGSDVYAGGTKRDPKNNGTFSSEDGGTIKAYNNHMEGSYTFIPYGASKYMLKGKEASVGDIDSKADFDAYVVEKRDTQVPLNVTSYAGANVYNNFDTDKSIMYSYTADEPATARDNVVRYAGRVQGGDFKWAFDNSVDDAASEVNQKLKDALMAYKGSNGEVMDYSSSSVIPDSVPGSSSSKEEQALAKMVPSNGYLFYDSNSDRLVIGTNNVVRLDIIGIDGHRVDVAGLKKVGDIRVLDLSSLRAGVYIVRLSTWMTTQTIKFVKKP